MFSRFGDTPATDWSRSARPLANPKSRQAPNAPYGRHFPKITAARAMNPRPAVMFWPNDPTKPIDR